MCRGCGVGVLHAHVCACVRCVNCVCVWCVHVCLWGVVCVLCMVLGVHVCGKEVVFNTLPLPFWAAGLAVYIWTKSIMKKQSYLTVHR